MTGQEALALGKTKFAEILRKFTGDINQNAPPPSFRPGMLVEVREKMLPARTPIIVIMTVHLVLANEGDEAITQFMGDRALPDGLRVFFHQDSALPEPFNGEEGCIAHGSLEGLVLKGSSYFVCSSNVNSFSLSLGIRGTPIRFAAGMQQSFQVCWQHQLLSICVKDSVFIMKNKQKHNLRCNMPLSFSNAMGSAIAAGSRVFVKDVLSVYSFTVSSKEDDRNRAMQQLYDIPNCDQYDGTIFVENPLVVPWYQAKLTKNVDILANPPTHEVEYTADKTYEQGILRANIRFLEDDKNAGGVLFLDEAHQLQPLKGGDGKAITNLIMDLITKHEDTVTVILGGYKKKIEDEIFASDEGLKGRFPYVFEFKDYNDDELLLLWNFFCQDSGYKSSPRIAELAVFQVSRHRESKGFSNARAMKAMFQMAISRIQAEQSEKIIQIQDVIGPSPSLHCNDQAKTVFDQLERLVGLEQVRVLI